MAVKLVVNTTDTAADLIAGYGTGAKVYLYSATSEAGVYSAIDSLALASGTEQYEFWDVSGTSTTWYKARYGNLGATIFSDYGDAFQASSLTAYATLDDLLETMDMPTGSGSSTRLNLLADLLADASAMIDTACSRRFYRSPQVSGTETFYLDVAHGGRASLVAAVGHGTCTDGLVLDIVSVTSLYTRDSETSAYVEIVAGDLGYYLDSGYGQGASGTVWPYQDISLAPAASVRTTFPVGRRAVKVIGVRGFASVPLPIKRMCVDMAREAYRQGPGGGAQQAGVNQFGTPIFATGMPQSFRTLTAPGSPFVRRTFASF